MGNNTTTGKPTDGPIARYLNRRISLPISRAIVRSGLPISPDLMSLFSFSIGIVAALLFAIGLPLGGGVLAQLSSILDGCDGEIARLTRRQSTRGAILDAILDRLADGALIIGMTIFAYGNSTALASLPGEGGHWAIVWGFLALIGAYGISYSSAIARAMGREDYPRAVAGRDVRLFLIMLAGIASTFIPISMLFSLMLLALSALIELASRLTRT